MRAKLRLDELERHKGVRANPQGVVQPGPQLHSTCTQAQQQAVTVPPRLVAAGSEAVGSKVVRLFLRLFVGN